MRTVSYPHFCFSWSSGFAVETLGTGDTPPVTFVLYGVVVADADFVEPQTTGHALYTLHTDKQNKFSVLHSTYTLRLLLLAGTFIYKILKMMDLGGTDFSDLGMAITRRLFVR